MSIHTDAQGLYDMGLCILPARGKSPIVDWKEFQEHRPSPDQIDAWFSGESYRTLSLYNLCGSVSGIVVLDVDSEGAEDFWRGLIDPKLLDTTTCVQSRQGHHYWFRLDPNREQRSRAAHKDDVQWDLRGEGGGVIVPPSIHPDTGIAYEWVRDLTWLQDWPYPEIPGKGTNSFEGGEHSSSLAWLLDNPGASGRNNWVTAVLGHYAKMTDFEDGYHGMAELIWEKASQLPGDAPYTRQEFEKTRASVWGTEKRKDGPMPDESAGFLVSVGDTVYAACYNKDDGEHLKPYAHFGMQCTEVIQGDDDLIYVVRVNKGGELFWAQLDGETLGSRDRLKKWFTTKGLTFAGQPKGDRGISMAKDDRIAMLFQSQMPVVAQGVPWLGSVMHNGEPVFLTTDDGVITAQGVDHNRRIRSTASEGFKAGWHYGFEGTREEAQAVLREVMSFQDSTTAATFASIWALAPIKAAVMDATSLFPIAAIIAPSESGKTNGFFGLMSQLNGKIRPGGVSTGAAMRDEMSQHRSGFVVIDDPSATDELGELLRGVTSEATRARKSGVNWQNTTYNRLVSPVMLMAEGLPFLEERAMVDRTVSIEAPSPVDRRSNHQPSQKQWSDIARLMGTGSLSRYAGWYVLMAHEWLASIGGPAGLRKMVVDMNTGGQGRQAEKISVVHLGAQCFQYMAGEVESYDVPGYGPAGAHMMSTDLTSYVGRWEEEVLIEETRLPYLVSKVIPEFFENQGFLPSYRSVPQTAAWVTEDGQVRVHIPGLAAWWANRRHINQARALQLGHKESLMKEANRQGYRSEPIKGKRYRAISPEHSAWLLESINMTIEDDLERDGKMV